MLEATRVQSIAQYAPPIEAENIITRTDKRARVWQCFYSEAVSMVLEFGSVKAYRLDVICSLNMPKLLNEQKNNGTSVFNIHLLTVIVVVWLPSINSQVLMLKVTSIVFLCTT